jgi:aryl-alcohol dehydrogenase-like predicted oxidoreductase
MAVELVLGTANFGQEYGILQKGNGPTVTREMARRIVGSANEIGIREIDTALTYGPAQEWLAGFPEVTSFRINSKIPWKGFGKKEMYREQVGKVLSLFKKGNVNLIQWHNWEHEGRDDSEFDEFHLSMQAPLSTGFGVTTYGSETAINALQISSFKSIQLEYNLLTQAPLKAFNQYPCAKPKLYIRSVFLQGTLTNSGFSKISKNPSLLQHLKKAKMLAELWQLPLHELALRSAFGALESGSLVVGVNTDLELQELVQILKAGRLPQQLIEQIELLDASGNPAVDPRNWN